jgi:hypothetical protein
MKRLALVSAAAGVVVTFGVCVVAVMQSLAVLDLESIEQL